MFYICVHVQLCRIKTMSVLSVQKGDPLSKQTLFSALSDDWRNVVQGTTWYCLTARGKWKLLYNHLKLIDFISPSFCKVGYAKSIHLNWQRYKHWFIKNLIMKVYMSFFLRCGVRRTFCIWKRSLPLLILTHITSKGNIWDLLLPKEF